MSRLGFIGLGVMGGRMTQRLLDAGHYVTGFNRTRSRADWLIDRGMHWADTPREAAQASEFTLSMVSDTDALYSVATGPDGILAGLGPDSVYLDMSTVSPSASRNLASQARGRGAHMLDAPVSGSVATLEEGALSFMVGGEPEVLERVRPILQDIGSRVTYVGPNGLAASMKVATNLSLPVQMLAFSEGLLLAEKSGIPRDKAMEVLLNSVIASPMLKYRAPLIAERTEEVWFDVNMMQKDLLLALELAREVGVPLPTASVTNEILNATRAMGLANDDFAIVYETLARMSENSEIDRTK